MDADKTAPFIVWLTPWFPVDEIGRIEVAEVPEPVACADEPALADEPA